MPPRVHVLACLLALAAASLLPFTPLRGQQVRVADAAPAREVERMLTFGPAAVGVTVTGPGTLALRATDADLQVRLAVRRDVMSRWLNRAEVMLLLVGDFEPVPPLKGEGGTIALRALNTWGSPRYELAVGNRDRSRRVVAELTFEEASDLLKTLRAVAPVIEKPRPPAAVDRPVVPRPGNRPPTYPASLRRSGVGGEVVLRVVIDTTGRVEDESIEVVRSSDPRFLRAARDAVRSWRFVPAESQGVRVRQLVELPFVFDPAR